MSADPDHSCAKFRPGDLVRDNHGRRGIVLRHENRPNDTWLREQRDTRVRDLSGEQVWLSVLCLSGGAIITPGSLTTHLGRPTDDDLLEAIEHGDVGRAKAIADLFPEQALALLRARVTSSR